MVCRECGAGFSGVFATGKSRVLIYETLGVQISVHVLHIFVCMLLVQYNGITTARASCHSDPILRLAELNLYHCCQASRIHGLNSCAACMLRVSFDPGQ